MSATNKVLIIFIAVVAFFVGAALNSARISSDINTDILLHAELVMPNMAQQDPEYTSDSIVNLLGSKITLVNFWASWCAPCREEMPVFEALYQSAKSEGFQIVGVAIDSQDKAQPMLDSMGITYPILYAQNTGMKLMEASGNAHGLLPYSLLLDENGKVIHQVVGIVHESVIINWLNEAGINNSSTH